MKEPETVVYASFSEVLTSSSLTGEEADRLKDVKPDFGTLQAVTPAETGGR